VRGKGGGMVLGTPGFTPAWKPVGLWRPRGNTNTEKGTLTRTHKSEIETKVYLEKLEGRGTRERENYVARDWYGTDMVVRLRKPSLQGGALL